jgi:Domain of unknown function (DUF4388)
MQGTSFVVLTGHLNDYPLSSLIGILRRQRKTGRLLVEYPAAPCSFYFENGELVDAQLNTLTGLQAVYVAMSQPDAAFNFNPLIQPPRRSIDPAAQQVLLESLGCREEKVINIQAAAAAEDVPAQAEPRPTTEITSHEARVNELPKAKDVLALPPGPSRATVLKREVFAASALLLSLLALLAVISLMGWLNKRDAASPRTRIKSAESSTTTTAPGESIDGGSRTIEVVVRIENGRVSQAFIAHPQPGMEAYEALALRIARQRRYLRGTTAQESVAVEIHSPGQ